MKIYPSKHNIIQAEKIDLNFDMPLAYIDTKFTNYDVDIVPYLSAAKRKEVIPYTSFDNLDVKLFDKFNNEIDVSSVLQRDGNKYYFIPQEATSFSPQRFNYRVIGKKQMTYSNAKKYNLKVSCNDDTPELSFAKRLIKIFGDAPKRGICPANINVNNQDLSFYSLLNSSIKENDLMIIESPDGSTYKNGIPINLDLFLNEHTNIWLSIDDNENFPILESETDLTCSLKDTKVINSAEINFKNYFEPTLPFGSPLVLHKIFNETKVPITIIEHPKKGFVVMSHKSFLNNIEQNINLFYEVMMYVYLNTYLKSNNINEWIADKMPDYIVVNNSITRKEKFTSNIELSKIFGLETSEISLADIIIDNSNIRYIGITNNFIVFDKRTKGDDPIKPNDSIAIFTPRQNIIYFKDFIYEIEDTLQDKITWSKVDEHIHLFIRPFKHSRKNINTKEDLSIKIPLYVTVNYKEEKRKAIDTFITCKENIINYVLKIEYNEERNGEILAEVLISQSEEYSNIFDIRQRGGGLPEDQQPDFNLLDIGHLYGRPYRKGGTLIITLPKRLEPYEEIILKAVKQHMVAEELPILLFE